MGLLLEERGVLRDLHPAWRKCNARSATELPVTLEIFHGCKVLSLIVNFLKIRAYFKIIFNSKENSPKVFHLPSQNNASIF